MLRTLPLLAVLVLASGCVASLPVASSTDELARTALEGETVRLSLSDGAAYLATDVEVGPERIAFRLDETDEALSVATEDVTELAVLVRRGRADMVIRGGLKQLAIGLAITGVGLAWTIVDLQSDDGGYLPSAGPALALGAGVLYTVWGTIGGLAYGATDPIEQWQTVYRRPSDLGLQPDAVTPR